MLVLHRTCSVSSRSRLFAVFVSLALALPAGAQGFGPAVPEALADTARFGAGLALTLTNDGFAAGGVLRAPVGPSTAFFLEATLGAGKDEREQEFFIGLFGDTVIPFKRHYFLQMPIQFGIEQRLFRESIEDTVRPFVQLGAGPAIGYQWPYFDDINENGIRNANEELLGYFGGMGEGEFRFGIGGRAAVGAYFGRTGRTTRAIRFGYAGTYYFKEVELLELDPIVENPSRRYFGSPIVSFHLLRSL
jgi:hypothetical protein